MALPAKGFPQVFSGGSAKFLGRQAGSFPPAVISRLKARWIEEYQQWRKRDLKNKHYVYIWADGVHFNIRGAESRQCTLVLIRVADHGKKELIAIKNRYRESTQSWEELLGGVEKQGLVNAPALAIGDGAPGFWKAVKKVWQRPGTNLAGFTRPQLY
ncbi:MAG: transposase [Kistimonas sp.]|nr:transposase [Kistimonas sp.]